jgi:hypothetical protein
MDYGTLKAHVAAWLNRTDLTSQVPVFIALAELDVNRKVRAPEMMTKLTQAISLWATLPVDCLEIASLALPASGYAPVSITSQAELDRRRAEKLSAGGIPAWAAVIGRGLEFDADPESSTQLLGRYYARIPAMSDASPSNVLLDAHWDLYLYGALMHAAPYLEDDGRLQVWATGYQRAMDGIAANAESLEAAPELNVKRWSF